MTAGEEIAAQMRLASIVDPEWFQARLLAGPRCSQATDQERAEVLAQLPTYFPLLSEALGAGIDQGVNLTLEYLRKLARDLPEGTRAETEQVICQAREFLLEGEGRNDQR